jgi:hypothetical protein
VRRAKRVQCSKVAPSAALRSCSICKTSASCRSTLSRFLLSLCRALACSTSTKRTQSRRPNIASLPHCTARKAVDLNNNWGSSHPHPQSSITLQGVPPSCCGRRVAVWSGVCSSRPSGFGEAARRASSSLLCNHGRPCDDQKDGGHHEAGERMRTGMDEGFGRSSQQEGPRAAALAGSVGLSALPHCMAAAAGHGFDTR